MAEKTGDPIREEFRLGSKAADMWLYTADACANEKVIPKKYRYTTGSAIMNCAETICTCIEGANMIDLREEPARRLAMQRDAMRECIKLERKIQRMTESRQYPGVNPSKCAAWSKAIMRSYQSWEAHAKHGDTRQLRKDMRDRLLAALARAEERRGAVCWQSTAPGEPERSAKRNGTVTFQSGKRKSGQTQRERPG